MSKELIITNRRITPSQLGRELSTATYPLKNVKLSFTECGDGCLPILSYYLTHQSHDMTSLTLQGCNLTKRCIPELCTLLSRLDLLDNLCLSDNQFSDEGLTALSTALGRLHNLTYINIGGNDISDSGMSQLMHGVAPLEKVRVLSVRGTGCGKRAIDQLLQRRPPHGFPFEQLNFRSTSLFGDASKSLARVIPHCHHLQVLDVQKSNLCHEDAHAILSEVQHSSSLTTLTMSENDLGNRVGHELTVLLVSTTCAKHLRILNIRRCGISQSGASTLVQALRGNSTLQALDLSDNALQAGGAQSICTALKANRGLTRIALSNVGATPAVVESLCEALSDHPTIQHVDYCSNFSGAEGAAHWCAFISSPRCRLARLFLTDNDIPAEHASRLVEALTQTRSITAGNFGGQSKTPPCGNGITTEQQKQIQANFAFNRLHARPDGAPASPAPPGDPHSKHPPAYAATKKHPGMPHAYGHSQPMMPGPHGVPPVPQYMFPPGAPFGAMPQYMPPHMYPPPHGHGAVPPHMPIQPGPTAAPTQIMYVPSSDDAAATAVHQHMQQQPYPPVHVMHNMAMHPHAAFAPPSGAAQQTTVTVETLPSTEGGNVCFTVQSPSNPVSEAQPAHYSSPTQQ